MRTTFLAITFLLSLLFCKAQTVEYLYDQAGNRTLRKIIYSGVAAPAQTKTVTGKRDSTVVNDYLGSMSIKIYPNPTKGDLGIELKAPDISYTANAAIYSGTGSLIQNQQLTVGKNAVDMNACPPGWYILRISAGGRTIEYKIIRQ